MSEHRAQDTASTVAKPYRKPPIVGSVVFVIVVLALVMFGYWAAHSGLTKEQVQQKIAQVEQKLHESGRDVRIEYGSLEIVGGFFDQRVVLRDAVIHVHPRLQDDRSTNMAERNADAVVMVALSRVEVSEVEDDFSSFILSIPAGVQLDYNGLSRFIAPVDAGSLAANAAKSAQGAKPSASIPALTVKVKYNDVSGVRYTMDMPSNLLIHTVQKDAATPAGEAVEPASTEIELQFGSGSTLKGGELKAAEGMWYELSVQEGALVSDAVQFNLAQATLNAEYKMTPSGARAHYDVSLGDMVLGKGLESLGLFSIKADLELRENVANPLKDSQEENAENQPAVGAAGAVASSNVQANGLHIIVNQIDVDASGYYGAIAEGELYLRDGEVLPMGDLGLSIFKPLVALETLAASGVISSDMADIGGVLLERVVASKIARDQDIAFNIHRNVGEAFTVGDISFEELAAMLVQELLRGNRGTIEKLPPEPMPGDVPQEEGAAPAQPDASTADPVTAPILPDVEANADADSPKAGSPKDVSPKDEETKLEAPEQDAANPVPAASVHNDAGVTAPGLQEVNKVLQEAEQKVKQMENTLENANTHVEQKPNQPQH